MLFMGMNQVRELTRRTQARILRNRPFTSLMDFLARADPRPQEAENLARCGALEGFGSIPAILRPARARRLARDGQLPLFDLAPQDEPRTGRSKSRPLPRRPSWVSAWSPTAWSSSRCDRRRRRPLNHRGSLPPRSACTRRRHAPDLAQKPHLRRHILHLLHVARRPRRHAGCGHLRRSLPPPPPVFSTTRSLCDRRSHGAGPRARRALHPPRACLVASRFALRVAFERMFSLTL